MWSATSRSAMKPETQSNVGCKPTINDTCWYFDKNGKDTILMVYADDILYLSKSQNYWTALKLVHPTILNERNLEVQTSVLELKLIKEIRKYL